CGAHSRYPCRFAMNIAVLFVPTNCALERGFHCCWLVAQFPFGLVALDEHAVAGHLHAFDWNLRFASAEASEKFVRVSSGERDGMRQTHARGRTPDDHGEHVQYLLQRQIARAEDIALAK